MKTVLILGVLFGWLDVLYSQVNLSLNGTTSQSSQYDKHDSTLAVIGGPTHEWDSVSCSATHDQSVRHAWWMLTFPSETVYISYVVIYYRSITPDRLAGYYLYVTNNSISSSATSPPSGHLCHHHDGDQLPNILQNETCNTLGKRVIIYNERKSGVSYPKNYSIDAILELCDVQIHGCYKSLWGENCSLPCPEYCIDQHCHPSSGACIWGCQRSNCLDSMCTPVGYCTYGCRSGFAGQTCDNYNIATYATLLKTENQPVNFINDGNKGPTSCVQLSAKAPFVQIEFGESYGIVSIIITFKGNYSFSNYTITILNAERDVAEITFSTSNNFSQLSDPFLAHIHEMESLVIGRYIKLRTIFSDDDLDICEIEVTGCPLGLQGQLCKKHCPENCDGPCDPRDGRCLSGCKGTYKGWNCSETCTIGLYGDQCDKFCPANCNGACHPETGKCVYGCIQSYVGFTCSEGCLPGKYGTFCNLTCPGNCDGQCDRKSGACLVICEGSYCADAGSSVVPIVIGVTVGVVVIGAVIIGVCVIYRRRTSPLPNIKYNDGTLSTTYTNTFRNARTQDIYTGTLKNIESSAQETPTGTSMNSGGARIIGASYEEPAATTSGLVIDLQPEKQGAYYNQAHDPIYDEVETEVKHTSIKQSNVGEYVKMDAKATLK